MWLLRIFRYYLLYYPPEYSFVEQSCRHVAAPCWQSQPGSQPRSTRKRLSEIDTGYKTPVIFVNLRVLSFENDTYTCFDNTANRTYVHTQIVATIDIFKVRFSHRSMCSSHCIRQTPVDALLIHVIRSRDRRDFDFDISPSPCGYRVSDSLAPSSCHAIGNWGLRQLFFFFFLSFGFPRGR